MYSLFVACGLCEKNIIKDNQKQYILEVTIIKALFSGFDQSDFVKKNILIF